MVLCQENSLGRLTMVTHDCKILLAISTIASDPGVLVTQLQNLPSKQKQQPVNSMGCTSKLPTAPLYLNSKYPTETGDVRNSKCVSLYRYSEHNFTHRSQPFEYIRCVLHSTCLLISPLVLLDGWGAERKHEQDKDKRLCLKTTSTWWKDTGRMSDIAREWQQSRELSRSWG